MSEDLRKLSKKTWIGDGTLELINAGSLQRIADATELMATNYTRLQADLEFYKALAAERDDTIGRIWRSLAAQKGQVTRLRNKLAAFQDEQD